MRSASWGVVLLLCTAVESCTTAVGPASSVTLTPLATPQRLSTGGALVLVPLDLYNGTADTLSLRGCPPIVDHVLERRVASGWVEERRFQAGCNVAIVVEPGGRTTISVPQPGVGSYRAIVSLQVGRVASQVISRAFEIVP